MYFSGAKEPVAAPGIAQEFLPRLSERFAQNFERIGDLAKNIAKRGAVLADEPITPLTRSIECTGRLVATRVKDVLDACTTADLERAMAV